MVTVLSYIGTFIAGGLFTLFLHSKTTTIFLNIVVFKILLSLSLSLQPQGFQRFAYLFSFRFHFFLYYFIHLIFLFVNLHSEKVNFSV